MFNPGIPNMMIEFKESSSTIATFVVSVYILGFAFGPLLVAPLSELYGRRHLYLWGNVLFAIFTVATALAQNIDMMLAFRFFMGLAGSVPITIGSGSIADMMPVQKRGRAMAIWALGPLLGPCIGPVIGGYLIKAAGWRWVYWLITIIVRHKLSLFPLGPWEKKGHITDNIAVRDIHPPLRLPPQGELPSHPPRPESQAPPQIHRQ